MWDALKIYRTWPTGPSSSRGLHWHRCSRGLGFCRTGRAGRHSLQRKCGCGEALLTTVRQAGGEAVLVQGDMSRPGESERVVEAAAAELGGLDGLINNAGGMLGRVPTAEVDDAHYARVMDLNARRFLAATRAAVPFLKQRGGL